MAPKLHFLGKQLLLQHILSKSKNQKHERFLRVLLVNNRFINVASSRRVYKVSIVPCIDNHFTIRLGTYSEELTTYEVLAFEDIYSFLKLLKPSFIKFRYRSEIDDFNAENVSKLMQLTSPNGKIGLLIYYEGNLAPLKCVWKYIDEIECSINFLEGIKEIRSKPFEELNIHNIKTKDELDNVLHHSARKLNLSFSERFVFGDKNVQLNQNEAKVCKLGFSDIYAFDQVSLVVKKIIDVCNKMEKLELYYESHLGFHIAGFANLLTEISQFYKIFIAIIKPIRQIAPKLILTAKFDYSYMNGGPMDDLPQDWQHRLKKVFDSDDVTIKETPFDSTNINKIETMSKFNDAIFTFKFFRRRREIQQQGFQFI